MKYFLKFENKKPSNKELGVFYGDKSEGAVRSLAKNNPKAFEKLLLDFKAEKNTFLTIEDYVSYFHEDEDYNTKINELEEKVKSGEFPGTIYVDGNDKETIYIPANAPAILSAFELLDSSNYQGSRVIAFGNYKGGVAKTTNVCNIAAVLAYMGKKVLIVDADVQGNATTSFGYMREDFKNTLIDLITKVNDDGFEKELRESIVNIETNSYFQNGLKGKIDLIPNSPVVMELEEDLPTYSRHLGTMENTQRKLLSYIKDEYDFVLIDTPPRVNLSLRMTIMASDYFIFALTGESFSEKGIPSIVSPVLKQAKIYKNEMGKEYKMLGGVVSKYEKNVNSQEINTRNSESTLIEMLGEDCGLFDTFISKSKIFDESQMTNSGAVLFYEPNNRVVRNYFNVTSEILVKLYQQENM